MTESQNKLPKIRVKLGKPNELKFELSVKGSTSDPEASQPKIRFLISEAKGGPALSLPMSRVKEGVWAVNIPPVPGVLREDGEYTGLVEVIVGNMWFNPTTVGLVFEQEVEVLAAPLLEEDQKTPVLEEAQEDEGEEAFLSVLKKTAPKKTMKLNEGATLDILFGAFKTEEEEQPAPPPKKTIKEQTENRNNTVNSVAPQEDPRMRKVKDKLKELILASLESKGED